MDRVHKLKVVHGPGPQGWSMDRGSMFCICPLNKYLHDRCNISKKIHKKFLSCSILLTLFTQARFLNYCSKRTELTSSIPVIVSFDVPGQDLRPNVSSF